MLIEQPYSAILVAEYGCYGHYKIGFNDKVDVFLEN
jgi:hypothetical protein